MMHRILLSTCAFLAVSCPALAADCLPWEVGFEYTGCTREGDEPDGVQVYAMPDGSVRRLTQDPGVAPHDGEGGETLISQAIDAVRDDLTGGIDTGPDAAAGPGVPMAPEVSSETLAPASEADQQGVDPGLPAEVASAAEQGVSRVLTDPADGQTQRMRSGVEPLPQDAPDVALLEQAPVPFSPSEGRDEPVPQDGVPAADEVASMGVDVTSLDLPTELPARVMSTPGQTVMLQMSVGHLNRIETPFSQPVIKTSQGEDVLKTEFDENFVYVTLTQPSTMFIHENGHPDPVIAVSLIPMKIMPRQVKVDLPADVMARVERQRPPEPPTSAELAQAQTQAMQFVEGTDAAPKRSPSRPAAKPEPNSRGVRTTAPDGPPNYNNTSYLSATILRTFSTGRMPGGFFEGSIEGFSASSFCGGASGATFTFDDGRMIYSADMIIVRGRVSASTRVQLDERTCNRHRGTIAVAFSPKTQISPDNPTDFYIVLSRAEVEKRG